MIYEIEVKEMIRKKLTIIHTTTATITTIPQLIHQEYESLDVVNLLDDSLLNEIKQKGSMSKGVMERFIEYAIIAQNSGSDAILLACSSLGEAANIAREILDIPLYKIDEPMAISAVERGQRILVLGTVKSTLTPTLKLIESKIKDSSYVVNCTLIPDVFELYASNREEHDQKIAHVITEYQDDYDVIVLAQASMSNAKQYVEGCSDKILTSLPLGIQQLEEMMKVE